MLALKGNQDTIHKAVIAYVDEQMENNFADVTARRHTTTEKGHGREETCTYIQMRLLRACRGLLWKGLLSIGLVIGLCLRNGKQTTETRYYISSLPVGVKRFARAVRGHWGIENTCHWTLDVTYREDESRIRDGLGTSTCARTSLGLTRIIHGSIRKRRNLFLFRWLRESRKKQCANQPACASVRFSRNLGLAPIG